LGACSFAFTNYRRNSVFFYWKKTENSKPIVTADYCNIGVVNYTGNQVLHLLFLKFTGILTRGILLQPEVAEIQF
jgi:hypothetical protein